MKLDAALPAVYDPARGEYRRQVGKSSDCSSLDNDVRRPRANPTLNAKREGANALSHCGTQGYRATHHGGMQAQFVAQVLGQVLEIGSADPAVVQRAYATAGSKPAPSRFIRFL